MEAWYEFVFVFGNRKGLHREYWQHVMGRRQWFVLERNTATNEVLSSERSSIRTGGACVFERRSALFVTLATGGRDGSDGRRALKVGEVRDFTLVQVAALLGALPSLSVAANALLGVLPSTPGNVSTARSRLLFKIGPEQYWLLSSADEDLTGQLQRVIAPEIGVVTSLSHSRTRLFIEGPAARRVLSTAIALDLHPDTFPVGAFALTGAHNTPVRLHRAALDRYEFYVLRTFAEWLWEWLIDAALPFGYEVASLSRSAP
jgi:methylglutamate dehydrogenase subunit D